MIKKLNVSGYMKTIIISDKYLYVDEDVKFEHSELYDKRFPVTKNAVLVTRRTKIYDIVDYVIDKSYELISENGHGLCGVFNFDDKIIYVWVPVEKDVDDYGVSDIKAMVGECKCIAAISAGFLYYISRLSQSDIDSLFDELYKHAYVISNKKFNEYLENRKKEK